MSKYSDYLARKIEEFGVEKFDPTDLAYQFIPYFNSGERVKVSFKGEEQPRFGTIGVTTGWKPSFLLMRRSNQVGSSDLLGKFDKVVAVKKGRKYQPVP
jgi:hypothetical protein